MRPGYAKLFKLLDGYAKRHHNCFLAELDPHEESGEYVACFRPLNANLDSEARSAYRYLTMGMAEVREMTRTGLLPISLSIILDEELHPLGLMR
jgi:hypothetical protein